MAREAGERVGDYVLDQLLGTGGFSEVWLTRATVEALPAALKLATSPEGTEALRREAEAHALLEHPGIVHMIEACLEKDPPYLLLRFVPGGSLRRLIQAGPLAPERALALFLQTLEAMAYAHANNVSHLDLKPENILLNAEGTRAFVSDFGCSLIPCVAGLALSQDLATTLELGGTLLYVAPERIEAARDGRGNEVDLLSTDIYALGVLWFEMVTGKLPRGTTRPSDLNPALRKGGVEDAIFRSCYVDASLRPATAGELKDYVRKLQGAKLVELTAALAASRTPERTENKQPAWIRGKRDQMPMATWPRLVGVLVAVAVGSWILMPSHGPAPDTPSTHATQRPTQAPDTPPINWATVVDSQPKPQADLDSDGPLAADSTGDQSANDAPATVASTQEPQTDPPSDAIPAPVQPREPMPTETQTEKATPTEKSNVSKNPYAIDFKAIMENSRLDAKETFAVRKELDRLVGSVGDWSLAVTEFRRFLEELDEGGKARHRYTTSALVHWQAKVTRKRDGKVSWIEVLSPEVREARAAELMHLKRKIDSIAKTGASWPEAEKQIAAYITTLDAKALFHYKLGDPKPWFVKATAKAADSAMHLVYASHR